MDYNSQKTLVALPSVFMAYHPETSRDLSLITGIFLSPQTLYSTLPALLDSNPFTAGAELPGPGAELEAMPPGLRPTLGVFQAALELTSQCELHPDLVSQTFGYLFFFSNASLLNSLMERGDGGTGREWGGRQEPLRHVKSDTPLAQVSPSGTLENQLPSLAGRSAECRHPLALLSFSHRSRPTFLSMVSSRPNPNQLGPCLGLATGGWAG